MLYGPVERAWILSSTRCDNFKMYMTPTVMSLSYASPVRPLYNVVLPVVLTSGDENFVDSGLRFSRI